MSKKKPNQTERPGRFIRRHHEWLKSPAYRDLDCRARCLLEELQMIYAPSKNGQLTLSHKQARERLKISKEATTKAFKALAEHGFIELMECEYWTQRKAREWRLTFEGMNGKMPTDDWQRWEEDKPVFLLPKGRKKS
ncbi:hypothetical protein [Gilvimarinus xylanilyticus]|uniref:Uncharacterized protein n=1 Tax=Gilvimarinus xylanilyticus TaxID=2944139 RepID=A0A9X2KTH8_9GAMM|nr:hypothetical protein [Gilvimarinus xylanilyticus]MCP8899264.1 hypothetical protein [Gilvimarinus xylanilyticus]